MASGATSRSGAIFGLSLTALGLTVLGAGGTRVRADDGTPVTVAGGADASRHMYTWTVTNRHTSPITRVEFPHYRATLFFAPTGWSTDCTFLVNVGVEDSPGACVAGAPAPSDGIQPGRSAEFRMQCSARGASRGIGVITIRFADGIEREVAGVELPQPEGIGDKFVPLIGLAAIAGIFALIAAIRNRRAKHSAARST